MSRFGAIAVVVIFFGVALFIQASVWNECRTDHSFFYCMQLMSHK